MRRSIHSHIIPLSAKRRKPRVSHDDKLRFISQYKRVPDPYNKKSVDKQYRTLRKFPLYLQRKADKEQRVELKRRGFFVTEKGVIIDSPRDTKRKQIPGAKFSIQSDATIKWTVTRRTKKTVHIRSDYIIGLTKAEKKEFARNPDKLIARKLEELKARNPRLRKKRDIQVRLQWGAYQATKDFHSGYFTKRYGHVPERDKKRVADRLTGLHFVVHSSKHLTGLHITVKERKHGKRRKKKSRGRRS